MRYESCVTSLSWIPSAAVTGGTRAVFDAGVTHYDDPPPGELGDVEELRAGGHAEFDMSGASPFPRHWLYDGDGRLARKSGLADFKDWYRKSFGRPCPWGDEDSPVLVTQVETALERALSVQLEHSARQELSGGHRREEAG